MSLDSELYAAFQLRIRVDFENDVNLLKCFGESLRGNEQNTGSFHALCQ